MEFRSSKTVQIREKIEIIWLKIQFGAKKYVLSYIYEDVFNNAIKFYLQNKFSLKI